jgi:hydroxylamine reductase
MTVTNVNFDDADIISLTAEVEEAKDGFACGCGVGGDSDDYDMTNLWTAQEDIRSLKTLILLGLRGMGAYAWHARVLGAVDESVNAWVYKGLAAIAEDLTIDELFALVMEFGMVNLKCMELLDSANTGAFGMPEPTEVTTVIDKGPFIVISGHDLLDLKMLLEQTAGKGVDVYTHGEMLPAHGYPKLKAFPQLKGNFGTAWQNQRVEFANVPGAFLFTTNCIMPPRENYSDRVFTTAMVGYPGLTHIPEENGKKDFTPVIEKAIALGGYPDGKIMTGINGGTKLTTGFGHGTVLSVAGQVIEAVKSGAVKHFFLVGGCDGAKPGRNYFTKFVEKTPADSIVLTLACGKFRFNDLQLGEVAGLPRMMDMGQCNDAYSAIKVALALADAFGCGVNDLPLSMVLSWYEQKAVCILLTLLALGVKGIRLGPTLPAFLSPNVLAVLAEKFDIRPVGDPEKDLAEILKK